MKAASQRAFVPVAVSAMSGDTTPVGETYCRTCGWVSRYVPSAAQLICASAAAGTEAQATSTALSPKSRGLTMGNLLLFGCFLSPHCSGGAIPTQTKLSHQLMSSANRCSGDAGLVAS